MKGFITSMKTWTAYRRVAPSWLAASLPKLKGKTREGRHPPLLFFSSGFMVSFLA